MLLLIVIYNERENMNMNHSIFLHTVLWKLTLALLGGTYNLQKEEEEDASLVVEVVKTSSSPSSFLSFLFVAFLSTNCSSI